MADFPVASVKQNFSLKPAPYRQVFHLCIWKFHSGDYVSQYFWDAGKYYLGFSELAKTVLRDESTAEPATDFQTTEFYILSLKGNMNSYTSAILPLIY